VLFRAAQRASLRAPMGSASIRCRSLSLHRGGGALDIAGISDPPRVDPRSPKNPALSRYRRRANERHSRRAGQTEGHWGDEQPRPGRSKTTWHVRSLGEPSGYPQIWVGCCGISAFVLSSREIKAWIQRDSRGTNIVGPEFNPGIHCCAGAGTQVNPKVGRGGKGLRTPTCRGARRYGPFWPTAL
jgi:hypothetical protein